MGTAESGKSTLCRHMRQLYGDQFDDKEVLQFKCEIQRSCLQYFKTIVHEMLETDKISVTNKDRCEHFVKQFENLKYLNREPDYEEFCLESVMSLWNILSVQQFIKEKTGGSYVDHHENKGNIAVICQDKMHSDNPAIHFLSSFERILSKDYVPSLEDILNLRSPTKGNLISDIKRISQC